MTVNELRALLAKANDVPWNDRNVCQIQGNDRALAIAAVNALPALLDVAENIGVVEGFSGPHGLYFLDSGKVIAALAKLKNP